MPVIIGRDIQTGEALAIGDVERRSGLYVLGKPGMGKSSLLVNLMLKDAKNGHGVFFLDPHGDAIDEFKKRYFTLMKSYFLLNPENDTQSFGINLLSCRDVTSLIERTNTYTRAYNIFHKLWEEEWGAWMQLIIQHTLYVFIENPDYTLAEVPLFLMNPKFREHVLSRVKYNPDALAFWRYQFHPKQAEAALTRVTTLLGHPYVKHIAGQKVSTINFSEIIEKNKIVLLKLSANLAPDIKKFIGTIFISELLYAVRSRPEDKRNQFCIFIDEFQNFASSEDMATLITEARKFGIATTISHQERFGQLADNKPMLGATAAAANKVFFPAYCCRRAGTRA